MRNLRKISMSAALCVSALLAFACNRQPAETRAERSAPAAPAATVPPAPEPQAQSNELRPEPKSVVVEAPAAPPAADRSADLDARERRLAKRQAEIEARERQLQRERQARQTPPPAPPPQRVEAPEAPAAPAEPAVAGGEQSGMGPGETDETNAETAPEPAPAPRPEPVQVPAGTVLEAEVTRTVSSGKSAVGDTFRARVVEDVVADDRVAIPRGSEIVGEVTEAVSTRKVGGKARLTVKFTDLVLPSGTTVPIDASFAGEGSSKTGRDAATIGGAAAGGAVIGHAIGGNSRGGSLIGALLGAAVGAVIAAHLPGQEVTIPQGTVVHLSLNEPIQVRPSSR